MVKSRDIVAKPVEPLSSAARVVGRSHVRVTGGGAEPDGTFQRRRREPLLLGERGPGGERHRASRDLGPGRREVGEPYEEQEQGEDRELHRGE